MSRRRTLRMALTVFTVAFGLTLLVIAPGSAHTEKPGWPATYCGHTYRAWSVALPNGTWVRYSESYSWAYTSGGVHRHVYRVFRRPPGADLYEYVHQHDRVCRAHAV